MIAEGSRIKTTDGTVYEIGTIINEGVTSVVYRAYPEDTLRPPAIAKVSNIAKNAAFALELKVITDLRKQSDNRFALEVQLALQVDAETKNEQSILVMGYVPSQYRVSSLCGLLLRSERKLAEVDILQVAAQYAELLKILHGTDLGYTCNDRKEPDLYWVSLSKGKNELRVLDWNVVKPYRPQDAQADLYNFGRMWYVFFTGTNPSHTIQEPQAKYPETWAHLFFGTRYILYRLLSAGTSRGYPDAKEVWNDLVQYLNYLELNTEGLIVEAEKCKERNGRGDTTNENFLWAQILVDLADRRNDKEKISERLNELHKWLRSSDTAQHDKWNSFVKKIAEKVSATLYPTALEMVQEAVKSASLNEIPQLQRISLVLRTFKSIDWQTAVFENKEQFKGKLSEIMIWEWLTRPLTERMKQVRSLVDVLKKIRQEKAANVLDALQTYLDIEMMEDAPPAIEHRKDYLQKIKDLLEKARQNDKDFGEWLHSCYPFLDREIKALEQETSIENQRKKLNDQVIQFITDLHKQVTEALQSSAKRWPTIMPGEEIQRDDRVQPWSRAKGFIDNKRFCLARQALDYIVSSDLQHDAIQLWAFLAHEWLADLQTQNPVWYDELQEVGNLLKRAPNIGQDLDLSPWLKDRWNMVEQLQNMLRRDLLIDLQSETIDTDLCRALDLHLEIYDRPSLHEQPVLRVSQILALRIGQRMQEQLTAIPAQIDGLSKLLKDGTGFSEAKRLPSELNEFANNIGALQERLDDTYKQAQDLTLLKAKINEEITGFQDWQASTEPLKNQFAQLGNIVYILQVLASLLALEPDKAPQLPDSIDVDGQLPNGASQISRELVLLRNNKKAIDILRGWRSAIDQQDTVAADSKWREWSGEPLSTDSWIGGLMALRHLHELWPKIESEKPYALDTSLLKKHLLDKDLDHLEKYLKGVEISRLTRVEKEIYSIWWTRLDQACELAEFIDSAKKVFTSSQGITLSDSDKHDFETRAAAHAELIFHSIVARAFPEVLYPYKDDCETIYKKYNQRIYGQPQPDALLSRTRLLYKRSERGQAFFGQSNLPHDQSNLNGGGW
jgi:serine/threonine protein kinase